MKVIVCVDNNGGMSFNDRRQSKDEKVITATISMTQNINPKDHNRLWMNAYTARMFGFGRRKYASLDIMVDEDFLAHADRENDYCFVEVGSLKEYADKIDTLIIFRWNRTYPADTFFDLDARIPAWQCVEIDKLYAETHPEMTLEIYERRMPG